MTTHTLPGDAAFQEGFRPASLEDDERYGKMFEEHRTANRFLSVHAWELGRAYPDQWVAIGAEGVVAHDATSRGLESKLSSMGVADGPIVRHYFLHEDRLKRLIL